MHASITNFEASDGIAVIHNLVILYVNFVGEKCTSTLIKDSFVGESIPMHDNTTNDNPRKPTDADSWGYHIMKFALRSKA